MTPQTWGFGYRRKTFPMNFSKILRAGFEPATYGCLIYHNYSPPLYQLSYRRLDGSNLQSRKYINHLQQCPWTSHHTYLSLLLKDLHMLEYWCQHGDVAQMVERSLSMWEVGGSIPPVSKIFFFTKPFRWWKPKSNCIVRESNPGRPRGRRAFYHWTNDAHIWKDQILQWYFSLWGNVWHRKKCSRSR